MIHTAELIHTLNMEHYDALEEYLKAHGTLYGRDFHPLTPNTKKGIIRYGLQIVSDFNGIAYFQIQKVKTKDGYRRTATAKIHLAQLAEPSIKTKQDLYDDPSKVYLMASNFSRIMLAYTGDYDLCDISWWNVRRCDYAVDLNVEHQLIHPYIRLFQRGELPSKHLTLRRWDSEHGDDNTTMHDENGSLAYNIYGKYWREVNKNRERQKRKKRIVDPEPWRNVLRFEMELAVDGIEEISLIRKMKTLAYDKQVLAAVKKKMYKAFKSYSGVGDYYRLDAIDNDRQFRLATATLPSRRGTTAEEENQKRVSARIAAVNALDCVASYRGLWDMPAPKLKEVKAALRYNRKSYGINPVTIPDNWDIAYLPNLGKQLKRLLEVYDRGGKLAEPETMEQDYDTYAEDDDPETMETPWD